MVLLNDEEDELYDFLDDEDFGEQVMNISRQLIYDTAKKYNIPEIDELIRVVYEDFEEFEISELTAMDILEIADASGLGQHEGDNDSLPVVEYEDGRDQAWWTKYWTSSEEEREDMHRS